MSKRKSHSGEFKTQVVLEAIRGELSVARLAARYELNPSMIHKWVKEAKDSLPQVFDGKISRPNISQERQIKMLHEKLGQLMIEREFLMQSAGRKHGIDKSLAARTQR